MYLVLHLFRVQGLLDNLYISSTVKIALSLEVNYADIYPKEDSRLSARPSVRLSVRPSVRPFVRLISSMETSDGAARNILYKKHIQIHITICTLFLVSFAMTSSTVQG